MLSLFCCKHMHSLQFWILPRFCHHLHFMLSCHRRCCQLCHLYRTYWNSYHSNMQYLQHWILFERNIMHCMPN